MRKPAAEELREGLEARGIAGPNVDKICDEFGKIFDMMWADFDKLLAMVKAPDQYPDGKL